MASAIVRFEPNKPQSGLVLKYSEGKDVDGQYGPQSMFTLENGGIIYLDPHVVDQLKEKGIKKGVPFTIEKRTRTGSKAIDWIVSREKGAELQTQPPATTATTELQTNQPLTQHNNADLASGPTRLLMASLKAAIDASLEATAYAARHGMKLEFLTEDIRAMSATVFIAVTKQVGV